MQDENKGKQTKKCVSDIMQALFSNIKKKIITDTLYQQMAFMKLLDVIFDGVIDITRAIDKYYYREVLIVNRQPDIIIFITMWVQSCARLNVGVSLTEWQLTLLFTNFEVILPFSYNGV